MLSGHYGDLLCSPSRPPLLFSRIFSLMVKLDLSVPPRTNPMRDVFLIFDFNGIFTLTLRMLERKTEKKRGGIIVEKVDQD